MRAPAILLTLLLILNAAPAFAGGSFIEWASVEENEEVAPARPVSTLSDEVRNLFGSGQIPRVSHVNERYKSKTSKQCRDAWSALRRANVNRRPAASSETIIRKAVAAGISEKHIKKTLATYIDNRDSIPNQKFIALIDFNKRGDKKRLFTIDLATGNVSSFYTAAGAGSDPGRRPSGYATRFSNRDRSHASSLGCALAAGEYDGENGRSLMLHGMEKSNDNLCSRNVVIHGAHYAGSATGRSHGCPAIRRDDVPEVFRKLDGGGLICSYKDGEVLDTVAKAKKQSPRRRSSYGHRRRRR